MTKTLLPVSMAKRLTRLSIVSKSGRLGQLKGTHRSMKIGTSLDFSDYREYHPGDDLRHIDWNVYARTEKPFIKRFLDEQEMRIHILLDPTKSMGMDGKWDYARQLSIALAHIALGSGDTMSFSSWSDEKDYFYRLKGVKHRASITKLITAMEEPITTSTFAPKALHHIPKASTILFIVTDGLENVGEWERLFKRLPGLCRDIRVLAIQSKLEAAPDFTGDMRFIDVENESAVQVTVTQRSIEDYMKRKYEHELKMKMLAKKYRISYLHTEVEDGVMDTVTKKLRIAGWIR